MKMSDNDKRIVKIGLIFILLAAAAFLLVYNAGAIVGATQVVFSALTPFIAGFALAYFLNVFVLLFERFLFQPIEKRVGNRPQWKKIRRPVAILLSLALVILLLLFIILFMIPELINSMSALAANAQRMLPQYVNDFQNWLQRLMEENQIRFDMDKFFDQLKIESLIASASNFTSEIATALFNTTKNVLSFVFSGILSFIFSIYLIFGKEKLLRNLKRLIKAYIPDRISHKVFEVATVANEVFYSFFKGQMLECLILGLLCYIGMLIFRFEYALLISAVIAISALIPIFGTYIGAALGTFILLLVNPMHALLFLVFLIILQQLENNLIYPRVVGSSIGLPAIWTMFAVLFWGSIFGIPGVWLGTPLTAVIYRIVNRSSKQRLAKKGINPNTMEPVATPTAQTKAKGR